MKPEIITIEPTKKTPLIVLRPGEIIFSGRSITENANAFYNNVLESIQEFLRNSGIKTKVTFAFEFINTSSIKWAYLILKQIATSAEINRWSLEITWYFEEGDEDMADLGNILCGLIDCQFRVLEVEDIYGCLTGLVQDN